MLEFTTPPPSPRVFKDTTPASSPQSKSQTRLKDVSNITPPASPPKTTRFQSVPNSPPPAPNRRSATKLLKKATRRLMEEDADSSYSPPPVCTFSPQAQASQSFESIEAQVEDYFEKHPDSIKYSKKTNHFGISFIKIDRKIYSIGPRIGTGNFGYVKTITDIESKKQFAIKIMAETKENLDHYQLEKFILEKLDSIHGFIKRTLTTVVPAHQEQTNEDGISEEANSDSSQILSPISTPTFSLSRKFKRLSLSSSESESRSESPATSDPLLSCAFLIKRGAATKHLNSAPSTINCWHKKEHDPKAFPQKYTTKIYFIMELHDNAVSFEKYLRNKSSLDLSKKLNIFLQLINKLKTLHQHGIVHNDLNPGNILIQTDRTTGEIFVNIIDFGRAHELNANHIAFIEKSESAPEHFPANVQKFVADNIESTLSQEHPLYPAILDLKQSPNTGFCSVYSDIYMLGNRFNNLFEHECDPFFKNLYEQMRKQNPFERPSLEDIEAQCQRKYSEVVDDSDRINRTNKHIFSA